MQRVVHCKRDKFDVYIGRPSKWGNPYSHKEGTLARYKVETREQAIELYETYLHASGLINDVGELRGKVLGCWCAPFSCHGDVLVRLANDDQQERGVSPEE